MRGSRCPCISRRRPRQHPSKIAGHKRSDLDSGFHVCLRFVTGEIVLKKNTFIAHATAGLSVIVLLAFLAACTSKVGGDVMATVDGRKIFRTDVDKYYENQVASAQQAPTGEQATALRLNILRQMIDDEILMRRAEKLGLLATDDQVDSKFNEIKAPFTQEEFDKRMQDRKITVADFKREIRRSLTVEKVMNKEVSSKINITDQDINDYYNAHKAEFNLIEPQYHLAQIMVTPSPNPQVHNQNDKAQNEADARKKIQMIANRLDSGDDFATLAMKYSEDPETAGNGGDLGTVPESGLKGTDPSTRETVMRLKPGQYSQIVSVVNPATKQAVGFRIVKLVAKEPAGQRDLSDPRVQQAIRSQLHDRRDQLLKAAYYEVLRDSAKVENYYAKKVLDNNGMEK
ncbi:MAG: SurA N-terminal domain-containing protein [Acidobacteriia bacterium]|nr:SurA N-terminal domain-containing protein [Terriglobia bacterium]